jgi:hypothetical protein
MYDDEVLSLRNKLEEALLEATMLRDRLLIDEGESDMYRKLAYYTVPNLQHWLTGAQAGNMKDLNELLEARFRAGKK